jgi:hypothetical protein
VPHSETKCSPNINNRPPLSRTFTVSRLAAIVIGLSSSATALTLPASLHALGRYNIALAVILGMAPAVLGVLALVIVLSTVVVCFTALTVALITAVSRRERIARGRGPRRGDAGFAR